MPSSLLSHFYAEYCIALVTVAGRVGPVRNSVLPEHLADLPNIIRLSMQQVSTDSSLVLLAVGLHYVHTYVCGMKIRGLGQLN